MSCNEARTGSKLETERILLEFPTVLELRFSAIVLDLIQNLSDQRDILWLRFVGSKLGSKRAPAAMANPARIRRSAAPASV
jgi:hypothetical protein